MSFVSCDECGGLSRTKSRPTRSALVLCPDCFELGLRTAGQFKPGLLFAAPQRDPDAIGEENLARRSKARGLAGPGGS